MEPQPPATKPHGKERKNTQANGDSWKALHKCPQKRAHSANVVAGHSVRQILLAKLRVLLCEKYGQNSKFVNIARNANLGKSPKLSNRSTQRQIDSRLRTFTRTNCNRPRVEMDNNRSGQFQSDRQLDEKLLLLLKTSLHSSIPPHNFTKDYYMLPREKKTQIQSGLLTFKRVLDKDQYESDNIQVLLLLFTCKLILRTTLHWLTFTHICCQLFNNELPEQIAHRTILARFACT